MELFSLNGTEETPAINFNPFTGIFEIKGKSRPEYSIEFYKPLMNWIEEYARKPQKITEVNVRLDYFNTSSLMCILGVFKKLEAISKAGNEVVINWYYEEDDEYIFEAGEEYRSSVSIPFNLIKTSE
ncbi:MAG: DUF1987 domain-containing protein [Bacteroidia bacterium]|nr:DUF1987 domain-containing protein [Bacteroidia bacterium]